MLRLTLGIALELGLVGFDLSCRILFGRKVVEEVEIAGHFHQVVVVSVIPGKDLGSHQRLPPGVVSDGKSFRNAGWVVFSQNLKHEAAVS